MTCCHPPTPGSSRTTHRLKKVLRLQPIKRARDAAFPLSRPSLRTSARHPARRREPHWPRNGTSRYRDVVGKLGFPLTTRSPKMAVSAKDCHQQPSQALRDRPDQPRRPGPHAAVRAILRPRRPVSPLRSSPSGSDLKGVTCVADLAVKHVPQDLARRMRESSAAPPHDRPLLGDGTLVHLRKVVLHDDRRLHEQS